jgi:hypothetical protein
MSQLSALLQASMQVFRNLVRRDDNAIRSLGENLLGELLIQLRCVGGTCLRWNQVDNAV